MVVPSYVDDTALLANQLGAHPRRVYYALSWIDFPQSMQKLGELSLDEAGETLFSAAAAEGNDVASDRWRDFLLET